MFQIYLKKPFIILASFMAAVSSVKSALVLEFSEVGNNVVLSFSGSVNISNTFDEDRNVRGLYTTTVDTRGLTLITGFSRTEPNVRQEIYTGTDLLTANLANGNASLSGFQGFYVSNSSLLLGATLDPTVRDNDTQDVNILNAGSGGNLEGYSLTFTGQDFESTGLRCT